MTAAESDKKPGQGRISLALVFLLYVFGLLVELALLQRHALAAEAAQHGGVVFGVVCFVAQSVQAFNAQGVLLLADTKGPPQSSGLVSRVRG